MNELVKVTYFNNSEFGFHYSHLNFDNCCVLQLRDDLLPSWFDL